MTIHVTPRRAALLIITALAFIVVYLLGTSHGGGAVAAAATTSVGAGSGTGAGITVTGTGKVTGKPDTLRLDLTVSANGTTVSSALATASSIEGKVQKALLAKGVSAKDLQTSGLSIQPQYTYTKSGQPVPRGYQVTESVAVRLRDLATAGGTITSGVAAGGNAVRIDGISLDLEDTGGLVSAARDSAFADAKAKAEQYAKAADKGLGTAVSVTEAVQNPTPKFYPDVQGALAGSAAALVPIQAGSQDVDVTVTVVFAFS
jgi:uncharacterized protein